MSNPFSPDYKRKLGGFAKQQQLNAGTSKRATKQHGAKLGRVPGGLTPITMFPKPIKG